MTTSTILCSRPPGLILRRVPRFLRRELPLAEEDVMSAGSDLASRMKAFGLLLEKGNSRQIIGLFETGLCPADREQEIVWKFSSKLGAEVESIVAPAKYYGEPNQEDGLIAENHRREMYSLLWSVLTNGCIKNPEVQKHVAQLVISNFVDIVTSNSDLSMLDQSVAAFVNDNDAVKRKIVELEQAKLPTPRSLASDVCSSDRTTKSIFEEALSSSDDTIGEIQVRAFFLRLKDNINEQTLQMAADLLSGQSVSSFRISIHLLHEAVGIAHLELIRDAEHLTGSCNLGREKLNILKIYINELDPRPLKNKDAFRFGSSDYSDVSGDYV